MKRSASCMSADDFFLPESGELRFEESGLLWDKIPTLDRGSRSCGLADIGKRDCVLKQRDINDQHDRIMLAHFHSEDLSGDVHEGFPSTGSRAPGSQRKRRQTADARTPPPPSQAFRKRAIMAFTRKKKSGDAGGKQTDRLRARTGRSNESVTEAESMLMHRCQCALPNPVNHSVENVIHSTAKC